MIFTNDDVCQILGLISENESLKEMFLKVLNSSLSQKTVSVSFYDTPIKPFITAEYDRRNITKRGRNAMLLFLKTHAKENWENYTIRDLMFDFRIKNFDELEKFFLFKVKNCGKDTSKELRMTFEKALKEGGLLYAAHETGHATISADQPASSRDS